MQDRTKTIALNVAIAAVLAVLFIAGNTLWRQWSQYNNGVGAAAKGDFTAAVSGYEAAIHMYVPLSPLVGKSARNLWGLAEQFERTGDRERALVAYRSLRSSFYGAKWLLQPGEDWIARCDERIARLVAPPRATP